MPARPLRSPSAPLRLRPVALAALLFLVAALAGGCGGGAAPEEEGAAGGADPKTDFRLATLEGEAVGPPDFAGKTVLLDFWATWCIPCHAQAEVLKEIHPKVDGKVQFLAVDVGEEETQVRGFVERKPFPYPVLLDTESEVADSLGVYSLPTLMVIDPEGQVRYFEAGVVSEGELCQILVEADPTIPC